MIESNSGLSETVGGARHVGYIGPRLYEPTSERARGDLNNYLFEYILSRPFRSTVAVAEVPRLLSADSRGGTSPREPPRRVAYINPFGSAATPVRADARPTLRRERPGATREGRPPPCPPGEPRPGPDSERYPFRRPGNHVSYFAWSTISNTTMCRSSPTWTTV